LYTVRGVLWMKGRPIRVTLEFSIWSATVSELALRPARFAWPVRTERYVRWAAHVLEDVAGSVTGRVAVNPTHDPEAVVQGGSLRPAT
jgi:hypothetical protein